MERVGIQDDFFDNGGDSLTAIEYTAKAHSMGIDFSLQNVFDYPTVQLLCDFLEKGESPKVNYRASDFDKYQKLFEKNRIEESFVLKKKALGNILLTGATGFLRAHVLDCLMREEIGKIYCLVRSEKKSVSHYGSYEYFHRVNVEGTRHIVNYSNRPIYFGRFLEVVHEIGIAMKVADGAEFGRALEKTMQNTGTEYIFEALQNDMDEQGRLVYDSNIRIVNDFTVWFLKKAGFEWNETDMEYIRGYINYFRGLGYLEV